MPPSVAPFSERHAAASIALRLLPVARRSSRRVTGGRLSRGTCPARPHDPPVDLRDQAADPRAPRASFDAGFAHAGCNGTDFATTSGRHFRRPRWTRSAGRSPAPGWCDDTRLDAVHARNHVPAAMALLAAPFASHDLIFDIRGLMAEEYVDLGRWRNGGLAFRITKRTERAAIRRAAGIVVLTERVRRVLFGERDRERRCRDSLLRRHRPPRERASVPDRRASERSESMTGRSSPTSGKLGGWYMDAEMADFCPRRARCDPGAALPRGHASRPRRDRTSIR